MQEIHRKKKKKGKISCFDSKVRYQKSDTLSKEQMKSLVQLAWQSKECYYNSFLVEWKYPISPKTNLV